MVIIDNNYKNNKKKNYQITVCFLLLKNIVQVIGTWVLYVFIQ